MITMASFRNDFAKLERHYAALFESHGDTPAAVQQRDAATQERRMHRLCEIGDISHARIFDFGCGSGHLLTVLKRDYGFDGHYTGYDLSEPHLAGARAKFPEATFARRDIFEEGIDGRFDYAFVSGVFNNRIGDNWGFLTGAVARLFEAVDVGVAFNALSTYVDYQDAGLYYARPEDVFAFCKSALSPFVTLRHDYRIKDGVVPFEFTVYVYRDR